MSFLRRSRAPQIAAPAPAQPAPAQPAPAQPAPAPAQGPQLSDAIALLKVGNKAGAEAIMRQIVGLPPINQPKPPGEAGINPPQLPPGQVTPLPRVVTPAPAPAPAPGLINRNMGPAPGQSYQDYMDGLMKSYNPYALPTKF